MRRLPNMLPSVKFTSLVNISCFFLFSILYWKKKTRGKIWKKSSLTRTAEIFFFQSFEILQRPKYLEGFAFHSLEKKSEKYGKYKNVREIKPGN